jgi:Uncharacterized protein conserved in archaea, COG5399
VSYPAPLTRELLEKIRKYSPKRVENRVEVALPIFEIVHGAQWAGESLQVGDATVVFSVYRRRHHRGGSQRRGAESLGG